MIEEVFRHYGHDHFDREKFIYIINRELGNKPLGGLWSCPTIDKDIDWKMFSEGNDFHKERLNKWFDFVIPNEANILVITSKEDLESLPRVNSKDETLQFIFEHDSMNMDIDFEKLAKEYDGMLVYMYRDKNLSKENFFSGIYYELYGWDVDTLLVFNPRIIKEVGSSDNRYNNK